MKTTMKKTKLDSTNLETQIGRTIVYQYSSPRHRRGPVHGLLSDVIHNPGHGRGFSVSWTMRWDDHVPFGAAFVASPHCDRHYGSAWGFADENGPHQIGRVVVGPAQGPVLELLQRWGLLNARDLPAPSLVR